MPTTPSFAKDRRIALDRLPPPRRVAFDAPWSWLGAGWADLWSAPFVSLGYGAAFALAAGGLGIVLASVGAQSVFLVLAGGFLLIGPLFAVGLYETSRQLSVGGTPTIGSVIFAGFGAGSQLAFMGAVLLFSFMVWIQLAFLLFMLFMGSTGLPPPSAFMQTLLFTNQGLGLLVVGTIVGGLCAGVVFAISAVSVPLLMNARIDPITAARASVDAVLVNWKPMLLWAALIVIIMGAGFIALLVGLAISFPLVGHATWHAYREIYGESLGQAAPS